MATNPSRLLPLAWIPFFLVPFILPDILPDAITRNLAALSTALFAAAWMWQSQPSANTTRDYYGGLFLLLCLLPGAVLLTTQSAQAPWFVWRQSLYLTAAWLVYAMLRGENNRWFSSKNWLLLLALFAHLYLIYALIEAFHLQFFRGGNGLFLFWSNKTAHFPGPLRQQNQQALFLVFTIIPLWRYALASRQQLWWELATILPIAGVFLTASRSGLIVLILAALLIWILTKFEKGCLITLSRTLILGAILSWGIASIAPDQTDNSMLEHILAAVTEDTPSIRIMLWNIGLHLWLEQPWLGIGWGNLAAHLVNGAIPVLSAHPEFAPIAASLAGGVTNIHNIILQFLLEGGVAAGLALLLLFSALSHRAWTWWRNPPPQQSEQVSGWICAVVILTHGMVSVAIMEPFFMVLLAISLAVCFADDHEAPEAIFEQNAASYPYAK
ncbi:MAG: O-antigen ligase family protein [Mariprofundales bacterium]|nr:O-antigen ligase family protein [Mariprofundales bacterium]